METVGRNEPQGPPRIYVEPLYDYDGNFVGWRTIISAAAVVAVVKKTVDGFVPDCATALPSNFGSCAGECRSAVSSAIEKAYPTFRITATVAVAMSNQCGVKCIDIAQKYECAG